MAGGLFVRSRREEGIETPIKLTDQQNGTYAGEFCAQSCGTVFLQVEQTGQPLRNMPKGIRVAGLAPALCTILPVSDANATAGEPATVCVELRSANGELVPVLTRGTSVQVTVVPAALEDDCCGVPRGAAGVEPVYGIPTTNGEGVVGFEYTLLYAGEYEVHVEVDEQPIANSPFNVRVQAAMLDVLTCEIRGAGADVAFNDVETTFVILCADRFENAVRSSSAGFFCCLTGASEKPDVLLEDQMDGTILCRYVVTHSTSYELAVTVGSEHIRGSPRIVSVRGAQAANCRLVGPAEVVAGVPILYEMRVLDDEGAALSLSKERQALSPKPRLHPCLLHSFVPTEFPCAESTFNRTGADEALQTP